MAIIAPNPKWQVLNNGAVGAGCKLYTYDAGTSTPRPTYTSSTQAVANANPVIFDSRGEAVIYFNGTYKLVLKDSADVTLWTVDDFDPAGSDQNVAYDNLIQNGSFETLGTGSLPANWDIALYTNGTGARASDSVYHGGYALKFTSLGSGGGQAIGEAFTECSEGMPLSVMFAIRSDVADVRNVVEIYWYDKNQSQLAGGSAKTTLYDDAVTNPTAWTVFRYFPIPPANARFCKVRLVGCDSSDATVGNTWFDGVSVGDIPLVNSSGVLYYPGDATITGVFKTGDGAAATPSVRRTATADGLFWAAGVVGVSIGGVEKGRFTSTGLNNCAIGATTPAAINGTTGSFTGQITVAAGSAAAPQIRSATDATGFYFPVNQIGVSITGVSVGLFTSTGLNGCAVGATTASTGAFTTLAASGDFSIATNKFTVAAATGNTVAAGTLTSTGAFTASSTANVVGDFSIATNKFTVAAATGNTAVTGTLGVTGLITATGGIITKHNGTTAAGQAVESGTYTPILSTLVNATQGSQNVCNYFRIGNVCYVSGYLNINPTANGNWSAYISLPIPSTFTGNYECSGLAQIIANNVTTYDIGNQIYANSSDFTKAFINSYRVAAWSGNFAFHFSYIIK